MYSTTQTTFFPKPQVLYVDQDYSVKPPAYGTIDQLMKSLQDNGPLVAEGKMGPSAYTEASFKLRDKVGNQEIYGWKPLTFKEYAPSTQVILLGAKQTESDAYVYFTLAKDITKDVKSLIRGFKPLDTDAKVYIMSYENFLNRSLEDLHPICPHGQWLFSVPIDTILDGGETEKKCNEIGQLIFDHYKSAARGDSGAGRLAVIRICEAAKVLTHNGSIRKSHIERAWNRIGDMSWQWQA